MVRTQPLGLMGYLRLSEEERDFYSLTGRLPSERPEDVKIEVARTKSPINKGGRPRKTYHLNERRAYCLWLIAKEMSVDERAKITNRKLIELAKKMSFRGLFKDMTSQATLEQSISRGKKTLKIDKHWNSKVCVLLEEEIPKLQS